MGFPGVNEWVVDMGNGPGKGETVHLFGQGIGDLLKVHAFLSHERSFPGRKGCVADLYSQCNYGIFKSKE
jgi:hypothetical protein